MDISYWFRPLDVSATVTILIIATTLLLQLQLITITSAAIIIIIATSSEPTPSSTPLQTYRFYWTQLAGDADDNVEHFTATIAAIFDIIQPRSTFAQRSMNCSSFTLHNCMLKCNYMLSPLYLGTRWHQWLLLLLLMPRVLRLVWYSQLSLVPSFHRHHHHY